MINIPERFTRNTTSFANYWTNGIGKELLNKLPHQPDLIEAEQYIPWLFEKDTLADDVVNELYFKDGFQKGHQLITQYLDNPDSNQNDIPESVNQLFSAIHKQPEWLDKDLLEAGSALCRRAGASSLIVLRDYCLMGGYESAAINKPLIYTGSLKKGAVKRLAETLEFWVNITDSHALENRHTGFKSIIKTRLIHSYSRVAILNTQHWDNNKWGVPLNLWDMVATNLGFSLVYLVGLRKIGFKPTEKEIEGLFHFWKYVGVLLGIPESYLPNNEAEAIQALYFWTMTQSAADKDSIALAQALTAEPLQVNFPKKKIMKILLQQSHLSYNYHFLGELSCKSLQLPRPKLGLVIRFSILVNKIKDLLSKSSKKQYQSMVNKGRKEQEYIRYIYLNINAGLLKTIR